MQHTIEFKSPQVHPGLNVTIRNGLKWFNGTEAGDEVIFRQTGGEPFAKGTIVIAAIADRDGIPDYWLKFEHVVGARTQERLKAAMEAAYGPEYGPEVTVLFIWV